MKGKATELEVFLADEPYLPELAEEDYQAAVVINPTNSANVNVTMEVFAQKVREAFRKRMAKILPPKK